jgi:two-component system chemotaxis response regulator CheY
MNILLVDDKPVILGALSQLLEASGFTVHTAYNGLDAYKKAQQFCYDLFVVDHLMPLMDGIQFSKNLKKHEPSSTKPIVFMTTQDIKIVSHSRHAHLFDEIIAKPINEAKLLSFVDKFAGISLANNRTFAAA